MNTLLKKPIVTEKTSLEKENNKYVFLVNDNVNKLQIKQFFKSSFNVDVKAVNTIRFKTKSKSRGRIKSKVREMKKAIVQLKDGQEISELKGLF